MTLKGLDNHFHMGSEDHCIGGNPYLVKLLGLRVDKTLGEIYYCCFANRDCCLIPSKCLCLYRYIGVTLSLGQRSFFVLWKILKERIITCLHAKNNDSWLLSTKWYIHDIYISVSEARKFSQKRWKGLKHRKIRRLSIKQCLLETQRSLYPRTQKNSWLLSQDHNMGHNMGHLRFPLWTEEGLNHLSEEFIPGR